MRVRVGALFDGVGGRRFAGLEGGCADRAGQDEELELQQQVAGLSLLRVFPLSSNIFPTWK